MNNIVFVVSHFIKIDLRFVAKTFIIIPINTEPNKLFENHSIICFEKWIIH